MSTDKTTKPRRKRRNAFSNFGDGLQVYDVVFEVDKLDFIKLTEGKDSEKYKTQHAKAVKAVVDFNSEIKGRAPLSLSKCRAILQGPRAQEGVVFFNEGKKVASNKESLEK